MRLNLDPDHELKLLLWQVYHAVFRARQNELRSAGISPIEFAVLFIIKAFGESVTPAEMSRYLFRESHTMSELLIRMAKKSLVRKVMDPERANRRRILITKAGEEAYEKGRHMEIIHKIFSHLSDEEKNELKSVLKSIRSSALHELGTHRESPLP